MRRVVITGMGIVCPLGRGWEPAWPRLLAAQPGIGSITAMNSEGLACRVAGQVPPGVWAELPGGQVPSRGDRVGQRALLAARQAMADGGWLPRDALSRESAGISMGSGCDALEAIH